MQASHTLDDYDRKILAVLADDGRLSWPDLAGLIGLPLTPTLRRVRRLETEGYIQGYSAKLDEERLLGAMTVLVRVSLEIQGEDAPGAFEQMAGDMPEIVGGFLMGASGDYLLHAVVRGPDHERDFIARLKKTPGVSAVLSGPARKAFRGRARV
jgi:Lrp/AsnC family leucine-responsive transcriptional regulator